MRFVRTIVALACVAWAGFYQPALAQVQDNLDLGAVVTSSGAYVPNATYNSVDLMNSSSKGVMCLYDQISSSGSPSVTFAIQTKDAASGIYDSVLTSSAITNGANTYLSVYPGMQTSS